MAANAFHETFSNNDLEGPKMKSIKELSEKGCLTSVPSEYTFNTNPNDDQADPNDPQHTIPIIDYSLLTSGSHHQRSQVIDDLRKACEDWGFFTVCNVTLQYFAFLYLH